LPCKLQNARTIGEHQPCRDWDQGLRLRRYRGRERWIEIRRRSHFQRLYPNAQCFGGSLHLPIFGVDVIGIPEHRNPREVRRNLAQILQPLGREVGGHEGDASDVATGTGETRHEVGLHRIVAHRHDDRNCAGRPSHERCHVATKDINEIGLSRDQLAREHRQAFWLTFGGARLEFYILVLDIAELA